MSADAARIVFADNVGSSTEDVFIADTDGTNKTALVVGTSTTACKPNAWFAGQSAIVQHCEPGGDAGTAMSPTLSVFAGASRVDLGTVITDSVTVDAAGDLVYAVLADGTGAVFAIPSGAKTVVDVNSAEERMLPDGTAVVYRTTAGALVRATTTSPQPTPLVASGKDSVVRLAAQPRLLRVHRLEGHLVVVQEAVQALQLALGLHRLGEAQPRVARQFASDADQPLAAALVAENRTSAGLLTVQVPYRLLTASYSPARTRGRCSNGRTDCACSRDALLCNRGLLRCARESWRSGPRPVVRRPNDVACHGDSSGSARGPLDTAMESVACSDGPCGTCREMRVTAPRTVRCHGVPWRCRHEPVASGSRSLFTPSASSRTAWHDEGCRRDPIVSGRACVLHDCEGCAQPSGELYCQPRLAEAWHLQRARQLSRELWRFLQGGGR